MKRGRKSSEKFWFGGFKIHHSATIIPLTAMMLIVDNNTEQNLLKTYLRKKVKSILFHIGLLAKGFRISFWFKRI